MGSFVTLTFAFTSNDESVRNYSWVGFIFVLILTAIAIVTGLKPQESPEQEAPETSPEDAEFPV